MAEPQRITSDVYPFLLASADIRGHRRDHLALLDTGFSGYLALPENFPDGELGLPDGRIGCELAGGTLLDVPAYLGTIELVGLHPMPAYIIVMGNEYIIGRGVIDRFRVTFDRG